VRIGEEGFLCISRDSRDGWGLMPVDGGRDDGRYPSRIYDIIFAFEIRMKLLTHQNFDGPVSPFDSPSDLRGISLHLPFSIHPYSFDPILTCTAFTCV
jgi:hypothetical protein